MNTDLGKKKINKHNRVFQLEGTSKDQVQLLDHFIAGQMLKYNYKGIAQTSLQHWRYWGIKHFSRKPVPVVDHHLSKEMFANVQSKPTLTFPWVPGRKDHHFLLLFPTSGSWKDPLSLLFSKLDKSKVLSSSFLPSLLPAFLHSSEYIEGPSEIS